MFGSEKQKKFFKKQAEEWGLFPACPDPIDLSTYGDIFDLEILKNKHAERLERIKAGLQAIRLRRKIKKMKKGQDQRARRAGYKNHEEREAAGWTPESEFRKYLQRKSKKIHPGTTIKTFGMSWADREEKPQGFKRMGEDEDNARYQARNGIF